MTAPSVTSLLVGHWQLSWTICVETLVAAALYVSASRRVRRGWPPARTISFVAGLGAILVALQSGVDAYDDRLLSAHMVQHLILLQVAPILLLGGHPGRLALLALPPRARGRAGRVLSRTERRLAPLTCLAVFFAVVLATHLPGFYDATLSHPALHYAEHALYLAAGVVLWWPILGEGPAARHRLNGFLQLAYVVAGMLPMEMIGAFLSRQPTLFYPGYAAPAHALGISAAIDQQRAGAIMWVAGGTLMVIVVLWTAMRALIAEEHRQQAREAYAAERDGSRNGPAGVRLP